MRNLILILIFMILSFSVNILFYYVSDDYRNFLKQLKSDDNQNILINSEIEEEKTQNKSWTWTDTKTNDSNILNEEKESSDLQNDKQDYEDKVLESYSDDNQNEGDIPTREIKLWKNYQKILNLFTSYDLVRMEVNTNLFDITDEYPDDYLEYYSKNLTLYFFTTKRYTDLKDIFMVLEDELPFTINEVNNFWDNSFFINLDDDIDDNIVRIVVSNDWVVFWLKINKNDYNLIKEKLNTLRTN